ncbi:isocitrate/isopropylmalate family dehydrogenase [Bartonella sp. B30(2025)]
MKKKVLVLPGDGIGPEVCDAALTVLKQFKLPIEFIYGEIGWECWKEQGSSIPKETWTKIAESDAILLGTVTNNGSKTVLEEHASHLKESEPTYISPVIQLRKKLDLFANVRPVKYITGSKRPFHFCIITENTEGLYSGLDFRGITAEAATWLKHPNLEKYSLNDAAWTVHLRTRFGLERLFEYSFSYAQAHGVKRITFADRSNMNTMRESGQFTREIFERIAHNYPKIEAEIQDIDTVVSWLVDKPEYFDIIVAENVCGDVLSNLAAGLMGGVEFAPSANIGDKIAYFAPVHGSEQHMAGHTQANPSAMLYTTTLLLDYLGFKNEAQQLSHSIDQVIRSQKSIACDLGKVASTRKMVNAVLDTIANPISICRAAIITIGDELLSGQYLNTNLQHLSQSLEKRNIQVTRQFVCADQLHQIIETVVSCIGQEDLIILSGGLGPTSDDKTRDAIAQAVQLPLIHNEKVWQTIKGQLQQLGITPDKNNARQALFPEKASVLDNPSGTAPGFYLSHGKSHIVVLPGPPIQALSLLEHYLEKTEHLTVSRAKHVWTLIGAGESEIANWIDHYFADELFERHFVWRSPYVIVQLIGLSSTPLAQHLIEKFETQFCQYLVGAEVTTACEKLATQATVRWSTNDQFLLEYLQPTEENIKNLPQIEAEVKLSPSLETIKEQKENLGRATMTVQVKGYEEIHITFSYTRPLLDVSLKEYAAWLIIKSSLQNDHPMNIQKH